MRYTGTDWIILSYVTPCGIAWFQHCDLAVLTGVWRAVLRTEQFDLKDVFVEAMEVSQRVLVLVSDSLQC